jgi:hypothetical protein
MKDNPRYLGDGVYISWKEEPYRELIITTGSHDLNEADNKIFLEPQVLGKLDDFLTELKHYLAAKIIAEEQSQKDPAE